MKILLVEDDAALGHAMSVSLNRAGYHVNWAHEGHEADVALHEQLFDAVILDLGLPKIDGFEVLRRMRGRMIMSPVIILTARDDLDDRVKGLDLGADDYLTKPFKLPELEARLRAQIRRNNATLASTIEYGPLLLNITDKMLMVNGNQMLLSPREFSVLEMLLSRVGRVVSKEAIVETLCKWDEGVGNNAIEVYIHRIRKKLEPIGINVLTIRGLGYLLQKAQS
ncbi:response regulator transcription factor [Candidatus Methylopumilus turicensis]|uniref:DNA-binding response regulator in two-component regulatory system with QseC n=1 Tax=Candidatus Methylopumilus turicensis TaxID=1581680 RepID=A0A0B7IW22_9PROT|nr:response regulator transcription factor [Candidatus Methylopumilus turicensis]CEN56430.1 DNA-binding response regulator in two-component regulatory system with QseC [Candidatus Methylopumilus turicensis]